MSVVDDIFRSAAGRLPAPPQESVLEQLWGDSALGYESGSGVGFQRFSPPTYKPYEAELGGGWIYAEPKGNRWKVTYTRQDPYTGQEQVLSFTTVLSAQMGAAQFRPGAPLKTEIDERLMTSQNSSATNGSPSLPTNPDLFKLKPMVVNGTKQALSFVKDVREQAAGNVQGVARQLDPLKNPVNHAELISQTRQPLEQAKNNFRFLPEYDFSIAALVKRHPTSLSGQVITQGYAGDHRNVSTMSSMDKWQYTLNAAKNYAPKDAQDKLELMAKGLPVALALYGGSHLIGAGQVLDVIAVAGLTIKGGETVVKLREAANEVHFARDEGQLHQAAQKLADAFNTVGIVATPIAVARGSDAFVNASLRRPTQLPGTPEPATPAQGYTGGPTIQTVRDAAGVYQPVFPNQTSVKFQTGTPKQTSSGSVVLPNTPDATTLPRALPSITRTPIKLGNRVPPASTGAAVNKPSPVSTPTPLTATERWALRLGTPAPAATHQGTANTSPSGNTPTGAAPATTPAAGRTSAPSPAASNALQPVPGTATNAGNGNKAPANFAEPQKTPVVPRFTEAPAGSANKVAPFTRPSTAATEPGAPSLPPNTTPAQLQTAVEGLGSMTQWANFVIANPGLKNDPAAMEMVEKKHYELQQQAGQPRTPTVTMTGENGQVDSTHQQMQATPSVSPTPSPVITQPIGPVRSSDLSARGASNLGKPASPPVEHPQGTNTLSAVPPIVSNVVVSDTGVAVKAQLKNIEALSEATATIASIGSMKSLGEYLNQQVNNPYFKEWLTPNKASPFLRAVENAILRLGAQPGISGGLVLGRETAGNAEKWQNIHYDLFAQTILNLDKGLLQTFPKEVLDHLAINVIYRHSLEQRYNPMIAQQQDLANAAQVSQPVPMNDVLARAIGWLRSAESDLSTSERTTLGQTELATQPEPILDRFGVAINPHQPFNLATQQAQILDRFGVATNSHPTISAAPPPTPTWRTSFRLAEESINPINFHATGIELSSLKNTFIIGDVHGNSDLLLSLLEFFAAQLASGRLDPSHTRLLQIGDLGNKGPDSAGVVEILRLIEKSTQGMVVDIPPWLEKKGFDRILAGLNSVELVTLRGNHEEFDHYAMHMTQTADIQKYAQYVSEMMGKGLPDTVRSYLIRHPDAFANPADRQWLSDALKNPPVKGSETAWKSPKTGDLIPEQQALDFYQKFQSIWFSALQNTGDLSLFEKLRPLFIDGNAMFVHGGPPKTMENFAIAMAHATDGSTLPSNVAHEMLWRRFPTEERGLRDVSNIAVDYAKENTGLCFPGHSFVGHTMGPTVGSLSFSLPDGSQSIVSMHAADYGFGGNNLGGYLIGVNGEVVGVRAFRSSLGIKTETFNPENLPGPGLREWPNRFP